MDFSLESFASVAPLRRLADIGISLYARQRVARLDRQSADAVQRHTLFKLLRQGCLTRFGRDHNLSGIRTVADYQRQVPLRDYEAFWTEYWAGPFPYVQGATWPGAVPYFGLSSGTTSGATKYIPISRQMLASNQKAALTALAFFLAWQPQTPLLTGRLFFLGGSTDLIDLAGKRSAGRSNGSRSPILGGDLSGIVAREASPLLGPFTFPPVEMALLSDWDRKMDLLATKASKLPITMLSGVPSWLLLLFERLKKVTGRERIGDIWPALRLVIHGGTRFDPYRSIFRAELGDEVAFVDTYPASEGYIASEDPRHGMLRLIVDHGIFFEFVPVDELKAERPTRHTVGQVELGQQYAIVLTTCAGLWSYVLGDTVCFERREPPLLRFTGRTRYFLSAFGEHLISEEVERAVSAAATECGCDAVDFHVGPVFPQSPAAPGRHRYFVEFAGRQPDMTRFASGIDQVLCALNEDYQAHRRGDLTLLIPEVCAVRRGGFAEWMRSQGKLGGQHKVPRMDNTGRLTEQLGQFFASRA